MAKKKDTKTMNDDRLLDSDEKDLLTLEGYIKAFESCEKNSDIFARLTKEWDDIDVDVWKNHLSSKNMLQPAKYLFFFWENNFENKRLEEKDFRKFIEIFSLLESVFRNVLLRPYIPSYRIINMNCGPYRSFVTISDKLLFEQLHFHEKSSNLLIYDGNSSTRTIIYAITCSIFWHNLMMKLKNK
ncbi:unnamed protein product [Rotaria sordida]|uniref:Uncharacterized protein n=1 Tax=Rotaria sordida TaxID=392033 RepID=A0A814EQP6_9BILA|nr:unnamed protein product [Rotaria sordida]CAF0877786.1 unnamed protein product [Rotaria sordida]CAF0937058.1 unnamed protein product [Rotaria sordida]CAF0969382.1 unnamed protein product [Rotaria sordida]CAF0970014.1 unnamed protein product [Rotaria sordida]